MTIARPKLTLEQLDVISREFAMALQALAEELGRATDKISNPHLNNAMFGELADDIIALGTDIGLLTGIMESIQEARVSIIDTDKDRNARIQELVDKVKTTSKEYDVPLLPQKDFAK